MIIHAQTRKEIMTYWVTVIFLQESLSFVINQRIFDGNSPGVMPAILAILPT